MDKVNNGAQEEAMERIVSDFSKINERLGELNELCEIRISELNTEEQANSLQHRLEDDRCR